MWHDAARELDLLQLIEIAAVAIEQRRIGELPEMLAGPRLGGMRWQEEKVDVPGSRTW